MKFMPYVCIGDPSIPFSLRLLKALAPYSDFFELGVPFSDPIADGPAIQEAGQRALKSGANISQILDFAGKLRKEIFTPFVFMSYFNPIYAYGKEKFLQDAKKAGACGLIIPDLPFDEDEAFERLAEKEGVPLIGLISPSTPDSRAKKILAKKAPFTYLVSVSGTTGERKEVAKESLDFVKRIRSLAGENKELSVGFGISRPEHAKAFESAGASGVIIGSQIVRIYSRHIMAGKINEKEALSEISEFAKGFRNP